MIKREKHLLGAITIALNILQDDLDHYLDIDDQDAAEEVKKQIKLIKEYKKKWKKQEEQDQYDFGLLGLLSLHVSELPESLIEKLYHSDAHKLEDRDGNEHFFGLNVQEHLKEAGFMFTKAEIKALAKLRKRMDEQDCGYFRLLD